MAKFIALHGFCVGGGVDVKEGEFVMVPEGRENEWVWAGHVAMVPDEPAPEASRVQLKTQDDQAVNREPLMAQSNRRR